MASSPKFISILFLITIFSIQIQARESQFFSKVSTNFDNSAQETATLPNNQAQEQTVETQATTKPLPTQEQEPTFIPETQNGYGLYGHESGQHPPSTTTTTNKPNDASYTTTGTGYLPYTTQAQETSPYKKYRDTYDPRTNTNNNNNYYNKNAYETDQQNWGNSRFTERGYTNTANQKNNYQQNQYHGGNSGYTNVEKQGMSDTRYLENGRYHYDIKNENNPYPNQYQNSRLVDSKNEYRNGVYYGNKDNSYNEFNNNGGNSENSYEYNNSMGRYENPEMYENNSEEYVP
ncbi:hypothetical protein CFOL_v3_03855 [Cephalotus follicularis]|uniref:Protein E6-like n=1 Tax=Cephalotus follicularis TaxID=3775 RepID=A0A1Q3AXE2_CEPFO|nr:hypothetical protein CFOL_v3_03855 [Cephalotus follicularis]